MSSKRKTLFKILLTIFLLSVLLIKLDLKNVFLILSNVNVYLLLSSFFLVPVLYTVRSLKWNILLNEINVKRNFFFVLKVVLMGTSYGTITPGKIGELMRARYIGGKRSEVIPTIIWDRLIDVFTLIVLSVLVIVVLLNNLTLLYVIFVVTILSIIGLVFIMNEKILVLFVRIFRIEKESYKNYISVMKKILKNKRCILKVFLLTFCYYMISFSLGFLVLKALNPEVDSFLVFTIPVIILLGNIPITISGLGLRESIASICFKAFGELPSYGFSFSLLLFVISVFAPSLVGIYFILRHSKV